MIGMYNEANITHEYRYNENNNILLLLNIDDI